MKDVLHQLDFVAILCQFQKLKSHNLELRSAIQQTYRRANPRGAVVDVEKQLDRQIAEFTGGEDASLYAAAFDANRSGKWKRTTQKYRL